ncbi:MAG: hypothetical protein KKA79_01400, partial [Nanoarchaeota archaeon]|nr:hypothetical protein [Nanoarchaeota archaeon]
MALRATKKPIRIKISSERKKQLDDLIEGWDFETKQFAKGFLKTHWKSYYKGEYPGFAKIIEKFNKKDDNFNMIRDPEVFKSWEKRFQMTGEQSGNDAFRKIFRKELDYTDTVYLVKTLEENLNEYIVPDEFLELISNMFEAHLKKEVKDYGPNSTKKGFLLVTGPSGVGKTHTIKAAIEKGIFNNELRTDKDFDAEKDKIAEKHPLRVALSYIPFIN